MESIAAVETELITPASIAPRLLTIQESARYLSASVWAIRRLIWSGQIPFVKCGKRFNIARESLDEFIDGHSRRMGVVVPQKERAAARKNRA